MANGAFTAGTSDLTSTNLITALVEMALLVQIEERVALANASAIEGAALTVPNNVQISFDFESDTVSVNMPSLPVTSVFNAGKLETTVTDYLTPLSTPAPAVDGAFDAGDSVLTSTTKVAALFEIAELIQADEANDAEGDNNVTMTLDRDNGIASISATFNGTSRVNASGFPEFEASNYLA